MADKQKCAGGPHPHHEGASSLFLVSQIALCMLLSCSRPSYSPSAKAPSQEQRVSNSVASVERHTVVRLTPKAAAEIRRVQQTAGMTYLRVGVESGGCTGFMYDLKFDEECDPEADHFDDRDGVKVVVDKKSALYLDGATIDFQTTASGQQGFKFDNPNAADE